MKFKLPLAIIALSLFFIACKNEKKKTEHIENETVEHKKDSTPIHWSHQGEDDGAKKWVSLCDDFSDCGGKTQSPINIDSKIVTINDSLVAPIFNYSTSKTDIINNGHTVQFNISGDSKVTLDNKEYTLLQFHYHALSEHTIDGNHFPIEVHFVHKHSDSDYAVLGMMYEEGEENPLLKTYLEHFPKAKETYSSEESIDIMSLFPENKSYYNYSGSLTTPPCSEVVNWYVLQTPLKASKGQLEAFSEILHSNYRPIQSLNERVVNGFSE